MSGSRDDDIDYLAVASTRPVTTTRVEYNSFTALEGDRWGSSVDIIGNTVLVGAPGRGDSAGRVGVYNLLSGDYSSWTSTIGSFTDAPLRASQVFNAGHSLGSEVVGVPFSTEFFASVPDANSLQRYFTTGGSGGSLGSPDGTNFGADEALSINANRMLVGAPGGNGRAHLYNSSEILQQSFQPFFYNTATSVLEMRTHDDANLHFGAGGQIISRGFVVVGTANDTTLENKLYNFRQRGPDFTPVANDLLVPEVVRKSETGASVAIDGNTAVVGARDFDNRGAVFVYVYDGILGDDDNHNGIVGDPGDMDYWTLQATVQARDIQTDDRFGFSVALSGDFLIVGAPEFGNSQGAAYVFERLGTAWTQSAKFIGGLGDRLGTDVDVFGGTAIAGAPGENAAFIYSYNGLTWTQTDSILATAGLSGEFGASVALDQHSALIGAPGAATNDGAAAVYVDNGTDWVLQGTFKAGDEAANPDHRFGAAVDISGDRIVIGAPNQASGQGAAYTFVRTGTTWGGEQKLALAAGKADDQFGAAVAIDGEHLIVGAYGRERLNGDNEGEAFTYRLKSAQWKLETTVDPLFAADGFGGDNVGFAVAINGDRALVGAPQVNGRDAGIDTDGAGYVFIRQVSPPTTVTVPERQEVLIAGAKANTITGTLGGVQTSDLKLFDIADVTLRTGSADDDITIEAGGISAYGLLNFTLDTGAGADTITLLSDRLTPPAVGELVPTGDVGDLEDGEALPDGVTYVELTGAFTIDGGSGANVLNARFDTDWALNTTTLTTRNGSQAQLQQVQTLNLAGGAGSNRLEVIAWNGVVTLDGKGGSDQLIVEAAAMNNTKISDSGPAGDADTLTVFGTAGDDHMVVNKTTVALNTSSVLPYAGIEVVRAAGRAGDDEMEVEDSSAPSVVLDGGEGSDTYEAFVGTGTAVDIYLSDTGPLPGAEENIDRLNVPADVVFLPDNRLQVGTKTIIYDSSIEELSLPAIPAIYTFPGTAGDDTITLTPTTLIINGLAVSLAGVVELTINGGGGNDNFFVTGVSSELTLLVFNGGIGTDSIFGPAGDNTWTFTGLGAGKVTGDHPFDFTGIENVTGGSEDDHFVFNGDSPSIAGTLDGGDGQDILDYASRSAAVTIDLGTGAATATGGFIGIEQVVGSKHGGDQLVGANAETEWKITGVNAGAVGGLTFSKFENATGGTADDKFKVEDQASLSGVIDGGGGDDTVELYTAELDDAVLIDQTAVTRNGLAQSYQGIETVTIDTGAGADKLKLDAAGAGFPVEVNLRAGTGDDEIEIKLVAGMATRIDVDGGEPSASDTVSIIGTAGDDVIAVNGLMVSYDASSIDLTAVEHLVVAAGEGKDTLTVTGASVSGSIDLRGEGGEDFIAVTYPMTTGTLTVDGGSGDTDALTLTLGEDDDQVTLSATGVTVTGSAGALYAAFETLTLDTLDGADNVIISGTHAGTTAVFTGLGEDKVTLQGNSGLLNIHTGGGADQAYVQGVAFETTLELDEGDDLAIVSSGAPSAGTLDGIQAALSVLGGAGTDELKLDSAAALSGLEGTISPTRVDGFGMSQGLSYATFESLIVRLGTGDDKATVSSTHVGTTLLETGGGKDFVLVSGVDGAATVDTGEGDDTVEVRVTVAASADGDVGEDVEEEDGSDGGVGEGAQPSPIVGSLTVQGGAGADRLDVISDSVVDETGTLTATKITGLTMGTGITYGAVEHLDITLGNAATTFTIESSSDITTTTLRTRLGDDKVNVQSVGGQTNVLTGDGADVINVGSLAPAAGGLMDGIGARLDIDGEAGTDVLNLDDTGDVTGNAGKLTATEVFDLGMKGSIGYQGIEEIDIELGSGGDKFTIASTHAGSTRVAANSGDDTVNVQTISGTTDVFGGKGADIVNVGSLAPIIGGIVDGISARLEVRGDDDDDTLNVDDTGDATDNSGKLTATELTGLGMSKGIGYLVEHINISLGTGADTFTIATTHLGQTMVDAGHANDTVHILSTAGETEVNGNAGADDINVQTIGAPTTVNGGSGNDEIFVGSLAPIAGGTVNGISAALTVNGNDGDEDFLTVDDTGDILAETSKLTATTLTGLGMSDGITYGTIEELAIGTGKADQVMNIHSVSARTTVNFGGGNDTANVGTKAPELGGTLNEIAARLTVNGFGGNDALNVDDSGDTAPNSGALKHGDTADVLSGFGMSADGLRYRQFETLEISLGSGGNTLDVTGTMRQEGFRTITIVNTGTGNDSVTVALNPSIDGALAVNLQAGDDWLDAKASTLDLVVFGGDGDDKVYAGQGADIVFGDRGVVDYLDEIGMLVARLGVEPGERSTASTNAHFVPVPQTDGVHRGPGFVGSVDYTIGGNDILDGQGGNDLVFGGHDGDEAIGGEGDDVVFGDNGEIHFTAPAADGSTIQVWIDTVAVGGGSDTVNGSAGNDILFGGFSADVMLGMAGRDLLIGDNGRVVNRAGVRDYAETTDLTPATGGNDDIDGGADEDVVLAGTGSDVVRGGTGDDLIAGDNARVDWLLDSDAAIDRVLTTQNFGAADTLSGNAGADVMLGGFGSDTMYGDDASGSANGLDLGDVMLGDNAQIDYTGGLISRAVTTDTSAATGGVDLISGNAGDDRIVGGVLGDTIQGNAGNDVVLGDNGLLDWLAAGDVNVGTLDLVQSDLGVAGDVDTIEGGSDDDIVLGGFGGDVMLGMAGRDLLIGDNGRVVNRAGVRDYAETTDITTATGGNDDIDGGADDDVVLAGTGSDVVRGGTGNDLIAGDNARVDWLLDSNAAIDRVLTTQNFGAADTLSGNAGADVMLGGYGGDTMYGDDASASANGLDLGDVMLGDNAQIDYTGGLISRAVTTDTSAATGGVDLISGNAGDDRIVGGVLGDTIQGNAGNDVVLGDNGRLDWLAAGDLNVATLDLVESDLVVAGAADDIDTGSGDDLAMGGFGADQMSGGADRDLLIGDNGRVVNRAGVRDYAETTDSTLATGGADTIDAGSEDDVVLAGAGADVVRGGTGNDLVLGDNGRVDWLLDGNAPIDRARTTDIAFGDADVLLGQAGADVMLGGFGGDTMYGDDATGSSNGLDLGDVMLGDNGQIDYSSGIISSAVTTDVDAATGGVDLIGGNAGDDRILGGVLGDTLSGNGGNDFVFGDNGAMTFAAGGLASIQTDSATSAFGGVDTIRGDAGDDALAGGAYADRIDGGSERDLVFGDNVRLVLNTTPNADKNARFRALTGTQIYSTATGSTGAAQVSGDPQFDPAGISAWEKFDVTLLDHDQANQDQAVNPRFGGDYIAGGAGNDQIFGQLGDDVIQGDGSIDRVVGASRDAAGLHVMASVEEVSDGDDYIEGNGGADVIFGNLGQDDIIGGSSALFSLGNSGSRPDGKDLIFGGAGLDVARGDAGDQTARGHARDSDVILGDNGNIYRLVGVNGVGGPSLLSFAYDNYTNALPSAEQLKIVVRATDFLDYTAGGPDMLAAAINNDRGAGDELHGESGDDAIYGQTGNDVLFGEGEDDDLIGGWGHDWISGGTGQDGVLGDDGRIFTSRNGPGEALYGIAALTQLNLTISTPGGVQNATINVGGELKKSVDLTPFNPVAGGNELSDPNYADDIIYGGLGGDWLHGGAGDDAISGAEALPGFYGNPSNGGNALAYNATSGEFAEYDEFDPRTKIAGFLLNFDHTEGATVGTVKSDGDDKLFGDLGNDWLVGGTGRDNMYGGWGDDLINADDNQDSQAGGLNNIPDTHASYEDRAFGGAGRDRLIANTGGDRLIDWAGEFNSYIVPFSPFGLGTVSRMLAPSLAEFLYDLSESDGVDLTRGGDLARNGEPFGELGLVRQQDFAWHDQTGAPDDPQPGNIPGGKRDVLRSASFDDPAATGFFTDSGNFTSTNGELRVVAASSSGDAVSVFHVSEDLPAYFELQASVKIEKPTAGWKGNAYVIFDYQSAKDFKFAGIDESINKLVIGHRDASGWHVDKQGVVPGGVKSDQYYNMLIAVNGTNVTILVDNKQVFTHTYQPRIVDGYAYGLNYGYVGVGSDQSRGNFDNIRVQVLPPQITFDQTETFADGAADLFTAGTTGVWSLSDQRYSVTPSGAGAISLLDLGPDHLNHSSYLEMSAKLNTQDRAGFIFDRYGEDSFKYVAVDASSTAGLGKLVIGHYTKKGGWSEDAVMSATILPGLDYTLGITLKGTTVNATVANNLGFLAMAGYSFNASAVDGNFGLMALSGKAIFDDVRVKTNDPAFVDGQGSNMLAAESFLVSESASTLTQAQLDAATVTAMSQWIDTLGDGDARLAGFGDVRITLAELGGDALGYTKGSTVWIDSNAAGYGWSIGGGTMDLATVVSHELGHVLGLAHDDDGVMHEKLAAGMSYLLEAAGFDADPDAPISDAALMQLARKAVELKFDLDGGAAAAGGVDWQSSAGGSWNADYSPYVPAKDAKKSNFSDYLMKAVAAGSGKEGAGGGYDALGKALFGSKKGSKT